MSGPRRIGDVAFSPIERALLEAGKSYHTRPETRARTLAALGLATSAAAGAAGAAGATSLSSLAKLTWTKLLVAASLVGGVAAVPGGYLLLRHRSAPAAAVNGAHVTLRVNAAGRAGTSAVAHPPAFAEPAAAGATDEAAGVALGARPGARGPVRAAPLAAELAAVDGARAALAAGDANQALALLAAYERAHPHGRLEVEAEVLRMDALAQSGHADAARKHAEAFLRRHPNSVLAARARGYLQPQRP